jgi:hypothetical protein
VLAIGAGKLNEEFARCSVLDDYERSVLLRFFKQAQQGRLNDTVGVFQ